ncbi:MULTISPECIES: hypothetical protein [Pseudomonas]|uniref:Uncharacterized protein n=1 Tax=Pseudomonas promysalinigenes TaxID=485898 RepID=A0ABY6AJ88_9PSED|nr:MULTISPECIES: hypothetical protein [Pseudomonas]AUA33491.1 hypothetical protein CWR53_13265 [Pseudomonas sp. SGAir0191]UXH38789.1 hypothetical protein N5C08_17675 [Pseudomonas promysalinigenes]
MRHRGAVFWAWADPSLQHHSHEEMLVDGARLDVQVRLSRTGDTQLFIGIYERSGLARIEEAYAKRPGETVTRAMVWGAGRGRALAEIGVERSGASSRQNVKEVDVHGKSDCRA